MEISVRGFIYHKSAETFADCFDRYAVNPRTNKFAISDGVSKSFFPNIWAELLVEYFVSNEGRINLSDTKEYEIIQTRWIQKVSEIVNRPNQKFYVKNFFTQGRSAAATFVGLHFYKNNNILQWEAIALGDSFLFFLPKHKEINEQTRTLTHLSSKKNFEFDNFPDFFDSRSKTFKGKIKSKMSDLREGTFYLMTDALAEWFITGNKGAIDIVNNWKTQNDFETDIQSLRKTNLYNDDSAILIIEVADDKINEINYKTIDIAEINYLLQKEKNEISKRINEVDYIKEDIKQDEDLNTEKQQLEQIELITDKFSEKVNEVEEETKIIIEENEKEEITENKSENKIRPKKHSWEIFFNPTTYFNFFRLKGKYWNEIYDTDDERISDKSDSDNKKDGNSKEDESGKDDDITPITDKF